MRSRLPRVNYALNQRSCFIRWSISLHRRYLIASAKSLQQSEGGLAQGDVSHDGAPKDDSEARQNSNSEYGARKEEEAATSLLPLSPLIDPKLQAARNRYESRKPEPSGEPSDFQKKLAKNPYAQALATPVRQCGITGVRLPTHFLLDFGLTPHPVTGKPWQMPKLALDDNVTTPSKVESSKQDPEQATTAAGEADTATNTAVPPARQPASTVAGSYIVSQQAATKFMSKIKRKTYLQLVPFRWKLDTRFKEENIVWRKDMDTFILDLMRKKAIRLLGYLSSRPAAYIVRCETYEDIQTKHQPGAVLWLGKPDEDGTSAASEAPPPPYAMVMYRSACHIPVYNLPALLGPEYLRQLRDASESLQGKIAVIKQKRNTVEVLMHLWKLMGYMASGGNAP